MSRLIMSLGENSQLVAEVIGFLNYEAYPLYHYHSNCKQLKWARDHHNLKPVTEIIMACTKRSFTGNRDRICHWVQIHKLNIKLQFHYPQGMDDIISEADARSMRSLIYALVYNNQKGLGDTDLYLCLSGGRKTMSSDMQQAAHLFGCKAMLHILADGFVDFNLEADPNTIAMESIEKIHPVVYQTDTRPSHLAKLIRFEEPRIPQACREGNAFSYSRNDTAFLEMIEKHQQEHDNLAINYYQQLRSSEASSSFQALPLLDPDLITALKSSRITNNDLSWIYALPKTDLHCHLGGIADSLGLISIAASNLSHLREHKSMLFKERDIRAAIAKGDLSLLCDLATRLLKVKKNELWKEMSLFLSCFSGREDLLDSLVYKEYLTEGMFCGIGLTHYEQIGDYQGSSLLQTEGALRAAAKLMKADAERNNIIYKELRCSPCNYTQTLTPREVVEILWDELKEHSCKFRLIIIGSRHRSIEVLQQHVRLCMDIQKVGGELGEFICGFDLAGPEGIIDSIKLRDVIQPLLEECIKITIHAGETSSFEDIWKAVYQLNADRIGHGLSLSENAMLIQKLKDHRTAVEMCPSSNFQITGFRDFSDASTAKLKRYPLKHYLEQGLKPCICTDDPGISRTDISKEYLKASKMCDGGLSRWELLILIRNGLVSAFLPLSQKQELIRRAERMILDLV